MPFKVLFIGFWLFASYMFGWAASLDYIPGVLSPGGEMFVRVGMGSNAVLFCLIALVLASRIRRPVIP